MGEVGQVPGVGWQSLALSFANVNPAGTVTGFHDAATGGNVVSQLTFAAGQSVSYYHANTTCCYYTYVDQPASTGSYQIQADLAGVGIDCVNYEDDLNGSLATGDGGERGNRLRGIVIQHGEVLLLEISDGRAGLRAGGDVEIDFAGGRLDLRAVLLG